MKIFKDYYSINSINDFVYSKKFFCTSCLPALGGSDGNVQYANQHRPLS